jgi:hypothetical protein
MLTYPTKGLAKIYVDVQGWFIHSLKLNFFAISLFLVGMSILRTAKIWTFASRHFLAFVTIHTPGAAHIVTYL